MKTIIRSIMALSGITLEQYANELGINKQSLYNKLSRNSFTVNDLTRLVAIAGGSVTVNLPGGIVLPITQDD